jgi:hypothetical protein
MDLFDPTTIADTSALGVGHFIVAESDYYKFSGELLYGVTPDDVEDIDMTGTYHIKDDETGEIIAINGWLFEVYLQ